MKKGTKRLFMTFAAALCVAFAMTALTACGNDDDETTKEDGTASYTYTITASVSSNVITGNVGTAAETEATALLDYAKSLMDGNAEKSWTTSTDMSEEALGTYKGIAADIRAWATSRSASLINAGTYGSGHFKANLTIKYSDTTNQSETQTITVEYSK